MKVGKKVQTPDGVGVYHCGGPVVGFVAYPYDGDDDPQSRLVTYDVRTLSAADEDTPVTPAEGIEPAPWDTRMSNNYVAKHMPNAYRLEGRTDDGDWEVLRAAPAGQTHAERRGWVWFGRSWFRDLGYTEMRVVAPDGSVVDDCTDTQHHGDGFKGDQVSILLHPDDGDFTLNVDAMYYARDALHFAIVNVSAGEPIRGRFCRLDGEVLSVTTTQSTVDLPLSAVESIHYSLRTDPDGQ